MSVQLCFFLPAVTVVAAAAAVVNAKQRARLVNVWGEHMEVAPKPLERRQILV